MIANKLTVTLSNKTKHDPHVNGRSGTPTTEWCHRFEQLWKRSDWLFGFLRCSDDFYRQPIKLRLPLLFYLGHLPCFAWLQFRHLEGVNQVIDILFDKLFQRGVDPDVQTGLVHHEHSSPYSLNEEVEGNYWRSFSVQAVVDYQGKVRTQILRVLTNDDLDFHDVSTLNVLHVAIEHEMMHQEALMYLYAQLPTEALQVDLVHQSNFHSHLVSLPLPENQWMPLPGGRTSLGKPYNDHASTYSFGWDNEFPSEPTYVASFELQSHPVRIADYLQFVLDNGYRTSQWWDTQAFQWLTESSVTHPASWTYDGSYRVDFVFQRRVPIKSVLDHPISGGASEGREGAEPPPDSV